MNQLKAIREKCLECSGDSYKAVKYCPADGLHSTKCVLWPFRFGIRPETARKRIGAQFLCPQDMPDANLDLSDCTAEGSEEFKGTSSSEVLRGRPLVAAAEVQP